MRDYEKLVQELRRLADEQFFDFEKSPYIKAADAIEELSNIVEQYKMYLQDALNDLKAAHEKEPKWIPVTEENDGKV